MTMQKVTKLLFAVLLLAVVLNTPGFAKPKRKFKHEKEKQKDTSKEVSKECDESKDDDDYTMTSTTTATTTTTSPSTTTTPTTTTTTTTTTTPTPCGGGCNEPFECCFASVQCRLRPTFSDDCGDNYCPCLDSNCVDGTCQA